MALALVRCSIEADQGGTPHARARVSLVSWEGRSHALLFMVPLGLPSARPMAQALRLTFEYYIITEENTKFLMSIHLHCLQSLHCSQSLCSSMIQSIVEHHRLCTHCLVEVVLTLVGN